jgi:hypothetical protein
VVETSSSSKETTNLPQLPNKDISRKIAIASTLAALGLFVFTRLDLGVSLKDLSAVALPYEQVHSFPSFLPSIFIIPCVLPLHMQFRHSLDKRLN